MSLPYDAVRNSEAVMSCPSAPCKALLPNSFPNAFPSLPSAGTVGPPSPLAADGGATFAQFGWLGYAHSAGGEVFACWACGCWFVGSQGRRGNVQVRAIDYASMDRLLQHRREWQQRDDAVCKTYLRCALDGRFRGNRAMRCDAGGIPIEHYDTVKAKVDKDLERLNLEWEEPLLIDADESSPAPALTPPPSGAEYPDEWNWFVRYFEKISVSLRAGCVVARGAKNQPGIAVLIRRPGDRRGPTQNLRLTPCAS